MFRVRVLYKPVPNDDLASKQFDLIKCRCVSDVQMCGCADQTIVNLKQRIGSNVTRVDGTACAKQSVAQNTSVDVAMERTVAATFETVVHHLRHTWTRGVGPHCTIDPVPECTCTFVERTLVRVNHARCKRPLWIRCTTASWHATRGCESAHICSI
jgi:hypothetical protein